MLQIIDEEKLNELQNKTITEEDNASDENMSDDTLNFLKQLKNEQNAPITDVAGKTHGNASVRNGGTFEPIMAFNDVRIQGANRQPQLLKTYENGLKPTASL